ncbi:MAG: radical SAM protein [Candidatus Nanoarchaeia archaeon]|nr:radical SAM protein [Candidatus Nanoarchaeia archaeon]
MTPEPIKGKIKTKKITLISLYGHLLNIGSRQISSYLKEQGHKVNLLFLPLDDRNPKNFSKRTFSPELLNEVKEFCKDSDVIGISLMSGHLKAAIQITNLLDNKKVVWGGIHPTVCPEECMKYTNILCIGEGEEAMLDFINNPEKTDIPNFWFKKNGKIIKNEVRCLNADLDRFPDPDYDLTTHYISSNNKIISLTKEIMKQMAWIEAGLIKHYVLTSRGCPHSCTFCSNSLLQNIYKNKGPFLRKRSIERVIGEMEFIKKEFPYIGSMGIMDETFFLRTADEIKHFSELYKEKIGLPLQVEFSPGTFSEEKFKYMVDAGLKGIQMGVQTISDRVNYEVFKRYQKRETVENIVKVMDKYKNKLDFCHFHFITHNPFETKEEFKETIRFALNLPKGFYIGRFPLKYFPGIQLRESAKEKGFLNEINTDTFGWLDIRQFKDADYLNYLFVFLASLKNRNIINPYSKTKAKPFIDFLLTPFFVKLVDRPFILKPTYLLFSKMQKTQDF